MNRRDLLAAGSALAAAGLLPACRDAAVPRGGLLRVAVPAAFDPAAEFDDPGIIRAMLTEATQAGLVARDGKGSLVPGLARTWAVTDDGLTYMFRLRPDLRRADGSIIDAAAVVERLRRVRADAAVRPALRPLAALAEVASPAPGMVQLDLVHPNPALLGWLALPALAIAPGGPSPPASGPFAIADPNVRELRLTPNAAFYDAARVRLGEVRLRPATSVERAIQAFRDGEADLVTGLATDGLIAARAIGRGTLRIDTSWGCYGFKVNPASALLRDPQVRRALALAIDRTSLISRQFGALPQMRPAHGPIPPTIDSAPPAPDWVALPLSDRRAEAARLLVAAGWGEQAPLDLTVAIAPGDEHAAIVAELAGQLVQIGVRLRVQPLPPPEMAAAAILPEGVDLVQMELLSSIDDPAWFVANLWPELDAPWTEAAREALVQSNGFIALFTPVRWSLLRSSINGWEPNPAGAHGFDRLDMGGRG